ncbi:hypothetical protein HOLleu_08735 [Holothuria leucospilota]|uniref:Uncharacterized protein n=1 Tax=Holothuria leucospilota TaxID=206669 RepID=A0A9Q1CIS4_HOLLE|nr:hypothetical protein HOLleu_08735 [Holothuria leucospilota]
MPVRIHLKHSDNFPVVYFCILGGGLTHLMILLSSKEFVVMMDNFIGDQLISSLKDENLKLKLLEQKWNTLADLADVADNLILARAACRSKSYDTRPKVSGAPPNWMVMLELHSLILVLRLLKSQSPQDREAM